MQPARRVFRYCLLLTLVIAACSPSAAPSSPTAIILPSPTAGSPLSSGAPALTRDQVLEARANFTVEVISFDASQEFGNEFPYSDYVRLKITNGSNITLPWLTIMPKRFDRSGKMIGSSRAPSISVGDLKPGRSAEVDYYPRGHLPGVAKITAEIESLIQPDAEQFFREIPK